MTRSDYSDLGSVFGKITRLQIERVGPPYPVRLIDRVWYRWGVASQEAIGAPSAILEFSVTGLNSLDGRLQGENLVLTEIKERRYSNGTLC